MKFTIQIMHRLNALHGQKDESLVINQLNQTK